jgi:hypothetical protein
LDLLISMVTIAEKLKTLTAEEKTLVANKQKEFAGLIDEQGALLMVLKDLGKMDEIDSEAPKKETKVKEGKPYLFMRVDVTPRNTKNGPMDLRKYYFDGIQYPIVSWSDLGIEKGDVVEIDMSCLQQNTYEGTTKEGKKYKDTTYKILEDPVVKRYGLALDSEFLKDKPVKKCTKSSKKSVMAQGEMKEIFIYEFEGIEFPIESWRNYEVEVLDYAVVYEKQLELKEFEGTNKDGEKYVKKSWKPKPIRGTYPIIKVTIVGDEK